MKRWIAGHKLAVAGGGIVGLAALAWLAFGFFGVHTLFFDREVQEDGPVFASGAVVATTDGDEATGSANSDGDADEGAGAGETEDGDREDEGEGDIAAPDGNDGASNPPTTVATAPVVQTLVEGNFISRGRYSSEGRAFVLSDGIESFLRLEDFATDNGPDLFVYLVADTTADGPESTFDDDFVNLGSLRGNIGDQNYEIPDDVDVTRYNTVVIWCSRFSSAFGAADLMTVT